MLATSLAAFSAQAAAKSVSESKAKEKKTRPAATGVQATPRVAAGGSEPPQPTPRVLVPSFTTPVTSPGLPLSPKPGWPPAPLTTTISPPGVAGPPTKYPWRNGIITTTFWVGEDAAVKNPVHNYASSWDTSWMTNYGGVDTPKRDQRANYLPVTFTPKQNPFYIALPYNDVTSKGHKPEAASVIPWFKEDYRTPGKTVLKGRWVAVRFKDRVAYAQWEDCGPFRTDHHAYVFGNERPKPNLNKGAGLDVSPAVRDYLGIADTDVTDWRFVDFAEVPSGPWATHGENNTFVLQARAKAERLALEKLINPSGG